MSLNHPAITGGRDKRATVTTVATISNPTIPTINIKDPTTTIIIKDGTRVIPDLVAITGGATMGTKVEIIINARITTIITRAVGVMEVGVGFFHNR